MPTTNIASSLRFVFAPSFSLSLSLSLSLRLLPFQARCTFNKKEWLKILSYWLTTFSRTTATPHFRWTFSWQEWNDDDAQLNPDMLLTKKASSSMGFFQQHFLACFFFFFITFFIAFYTISWASCSWKKLCEIKAIVLAGSHVAQLVFCNNHLVITERKNWKR